MKKIVKRLIFVVLIVGIGISGWNLYKDYQLFRNGDGTVYKGEVTEDTGRYSTYGGNTANGSSIYKNESGEVMIHFSSKVNRGALWTSDYIANLSTGEVYFGGYQNMSDLQSGCLYDEMSFYEDGYYGLRFVGGKGDESYQMEKVSYADGATTILKEEPVQRLMVANGCTYYQYNNGLYRVNQETGEEELVVAGADGHYAFYNDSLYFTKGGFLYVMPVNGGEETAISDRECTWFFIHGNRIFYNGDGYGVSWLMSMNLDGTDSKAHIKFNASKVGMCDGILYYVKNTRESGEEIYYIDLSDSEFTEKIIPVREQAEELIAQFYGENIEKRVKQFPATDEGSVISLDRNFGDFEVCDGYILFYGSLVVNSWGMNEAFLYNIETGELSLLSEVFGLDITYDYYLR